MSKPSHTSIEINGKRYDARTGKLLSTPAVHTPKIEPTKLSDVKPRPTQPHHQVHKSPERSQTLMRHAVKRPSPARTHTASHSPARPTKQQGTVFGSMHHQYDSAREERAHKIERSNLVSKFSDFTSQPSGAAPVMVQKRVQPLAVQPAPALQAAVSFPAHPRTEALLTKGLQAAESHSTAAPVERHKKARKTRLSALSAGLAAFLLLAGFIMYQNTPNLAVRYASARAGVAAQLPDYKPSGFALNKSIQYNPGQVIVNFSSNSDDRNFTITQRSSSWSNDELLGNYVASASEQVHTYEDNGRTIYLYGNANATWVDEGVWYDINGNSELNSDQLIRIATSM